VLSELTTGATISSKVLLPEVALSCDPRDVGVSLSAHLCGCARRPELFPVCSTMAGSSSRKKLRTVDKTSAPPFNRATH
jgi:hypothetical protein